LSALLVAFEATVVPRFDADHAVRVGVSRLQGGFLQVVDIANQGDDLVSRRTSICPK
jgi:hypothetical protein